MVHIRNRGAGAKFIKIKLIKIKLIISEERKNK